MNIKPFLCFLFLASCLSSCHNNRSSTKQVFRYNEATNIATLDPAFAKNQSIIWAVHQLYNTLVETDSQLNIVPSLATRWEVSADRLQYTFYLRNDVFFHDNDAFPNGKGRLMNAHDVEFSFRRIMDPKTASSGAWIFNNRIDPVNGFTAINDSVFRIRLLRPFTPLPGCSACSIARWCQRKWLKNTARTSGAMPAERGPSPSNPGKKGRQ